MMEKEKHCLYVSTFPNTQAKQYILLQGINNDTSFAAIDEFMQQQKEDADHTKKVMNKQKKVKRKRKIIKVTIKTGTIVNIIWI